MEDDIPPITKRIICISGFTQERLGQTGLARVWLKLRQLHKSVDCEVSQHTWREDWRLFVQHLLSTGPRDLKRFDISIVAYSWGVGHGAQRLCELLLGEGINVRVLVSCDGVYRNRWMIWRTLCSPLLGNTIVIPANVAKVHMIRQNKNWPHGHEIVADVPESTQIVDHGFLRGYSHQDIDNSQVFYDLAIEATQ